MGLFGKFFVWSAGKAHAAGAEETGAPATKKAAPAHIGRRRSICWWEPVYKPKLDGKLKPCDWSFTDNSGPVEQFIFGPSLSGQVERGDTYKVEHRSFIDCDFQGDFTPGTIVMFDNCTFLRCDFAYSKWRDTNFRNCRFIDCSFSLCEFERCEFRDNTFERIGISGSKTEFLRCFITNPDQLVLSTYSGTNPADKGLKHKHYQWHRLQGTRAHILRTLMISHEAVGDDETFYLTAKLHDKYQPYAKLAKFAFGSLYGEYGGRPPNIVKLVWCLVEHLLLNLIGVINGWGSSVLRPLFLLFLTSTTFGYVYSFTWGVNGLQKSFNIASLAGYSNEYHETLSESLVKLQNVQLAISIVFYTVFFATVISKVSRSR